jgi:diacylglycerol kinase (ATP)
MSATVIINPYANRWEARRRKYEIETKLEQSNIDFTLHETEYQGHGVDIARTATREGNLPLIAAGGDGSISEVVNGLLQATPPDDLPAGPIGFLPLGTANDLTDMLGIPRNLTDAIEVIAQGNCRVIDVGKVNGHYFDNNSAVGLEPMVTIENIRLTWLRGVIRYMVSAIITILKRRTWNANIYWDEGEYHGSITLVSVGNTRRTGGIFFMTPNASVEDGFLDFIYAPVLKRFKLFQLLPKTQNGSHIMDPEIFEGRTTKLIIQTRPPTPIQADGEIIATGAEEITYEIVPNALKVFSPLYKKT